MSKLEIMDHTGHTTVNFDTADGVALKVASDKFAELVGGRGFLAYAPDGNGGGRTLKAFDPSVDTIVLRPPLIGG